MAGEELHYQLQWLVIPVGGITIKNEGVREYRGSQCYYLTARTQLNKFLQNLFDVRYFVESYLDKESLCSLKFVKTRFTKGEQSRVDIDFYPQNNSAVFSVSGSSPSFKISASRGKIENNHPLTQKIPPRTQDLLSSFYYFRLQDIKAGESLPMNIYYDQRNFPVKMLVGESFRSEIRKVGIFWVFEANPGSGINEYIMGGRKFKVYFTADSRRIPVEFKLSTALGSLHAIIEDTPR